MSILLFRGLKVYILSGLLSAMVARVLYGLVNQTETRFMIVLVAPTVEEIFKTGLAILMDTNIFFAHIVFGVVEFVSDSFGGSGIWPGLVAVALHSLLGYVTTWFLFHMGNVVTAVVAVIVIHAFWNYAAVRLLGASKDMS